MSYVLKRASLGTREYKNTLKDLLPQIRRNSKAAEYQMTDIFCNVFLSTIRASHTVYCLQTLRGQGLSTLSCSDPQNKKLSFTMRSPKVSELHRQLTLHHKIKAV